MSERTREQWALEIASRGFFIFPIHPNIKEPPKGVSWMSELMTRDPAKIKEWFAQNANINYGVCPGPAGAIIDVDDGKQGKNGIAAFSAFELEQDLTDIVMGQTFEVVSPSGGHHLYLSVDEPISNTSGFGKDIDVRGAGGYVVGPGCYFDRDIAGKPDQVSGYYTVLHDKEFMKAPQWCRDKMRAGELKREPVQEIVAEDLPESISQAKQFIRSRLPAIEGMGGDAFTYTTCCVIRRDFNISQDMTLKLLTEYKYTTPTDPDDEPRSWNDRCDPPWDVYGQHGTLESKVRNAEAYARHNSGEKSGAILTHGLDFETVAEATQAAREMAEEVDERRKLIMSNLLRGKEIYKKVKQQRYVIPFWLTTTGIHGAIGKRGVGKSILMMDMLLHIAHDLDWHTVPTVKGWTVVYLCGEDPSGAVQAMKAWCKVHRDGHDEPDENRFVFMPGMINLADDEEVRLFADIIRECVGKEKVIFAIDTWQRAISHLSQNEDREMQHAVKMAEQLGRSVNGPVVVAFHPPKTNEKTISGWQGQENSATAIWQIEDDAQGLKLYVERIKGKGKGNHQIFSWDERDTGDHDLDFGFKMTSIVPKRVGGTVILPDGTTRNEVNLTAIRDALCHVLVELERCRPDESPSIKTGYSPKQAAERIIGGVAGATKPALAERSDEWAVSQMSLLTTAGLKLPTTIESLANLIESVLDANERPGGFELPDGTCLKLITSGNHKKLTVSVGGIAAGLTT